MIAPTMKGTTSATSVAAAERLFNNLHGHLVNVERVIVEIIETKAWLPLGYKTFAEAWTDRMADVRLATEGMRAVVVYALLETSTIDEVVANTRGVGPDVVKELKRQKAAGVPAKFAVVRRHIRRKPSPPRTIHVTIAEVEYTAWSDACDASGTTLVAESERVLRAHFEGS